MRKNKELERVSIRCRQIEARSSACALTQAGFGAMIISICRPSIRGSCSIFA
jgi:hypothetical protein